MNCSLDASVPRVESSRLKRPEAGCTLLSDRPRGRCELIRVSQAEHAQLVDVEREREFPWIHRRCQDDPGDKHGELIAEARIDDAAFIRKCLN